MATSMLPAFDLKRGLTWRLDQSKRLVSLLDSKGSWYNTNVNQFWDGWFSSVFNLPTANDFGVSVWAYILGVPIGALGLQDKYRYWGFGELRGNYRASWDVVGDVPLSSGNFPPVSPGGGSVITTQWERVAALRIRYYALTMNATIGGINAALADVFGEQGRAYVIDHEDMTMTYVFEFAVSQTLRSAMLQYGLLPKPAGVKIIIQAS